MENFFLHKSGWIFVFYMYIHTLYLTQVKLCWMSPTWPKPTVSPKEGSLRQRTWQRALPRHRCPSTERWELRRAKRKNTENRMVSERGRRERESERERGDGEEEKGLRQPEALSPLSLCYPPKPRNKPICDDCNSPLSRLQNWTCCSHSFGQVTPEFSEYTCHQIL